jgi:DNA excision repair protein ERCC-3
LPAPVFRVTAQIQARRRLGLTATLVREDGREGDVFSLIGPKKYDVPWRELEPKAGSPRPPAPRSASPCPTASAWNMPSPNGATSTASPARTRPRRRHRRPSARTLRRPAGPGHRPVSQAASQISKRFDIPLITGQTGNKEREDLYGKFRSGEQRHLVLSKVGNFAIDLPDANVLIQVSGTFGSRQEEAQRLGRILRPKTNGEKPTSTRW